MLECDDVQVGSIRRERAESRSEENTNVSDVDWEV